MAISESADSRIEVCDLHDARWTSFVAMHPEAGPFHHPAWSEVLAAAYGYSPLLLAVTGPGALQAGMPLLEVRSWLTGHRFICLPFTDYCPPLATNQATLSHLVAGVAEWGTDSVQAPIEVHAELPAQMNVHVGGVGLRHTLVLEPDHQRLFGSFKPEIRKAIHKAETNRVEVHLGQSRAELDIYYQMHCDTRHRQGVPVQPRRFFAQLWEGLLSRDLGFTALAYRAGKPIAGEVFFAWNRRMIAMYGASDPAHWEVRPNNLVMWKAMEWGSEHGYRLFDFGRTDLDQPGLREFKRRWGATEMPLVYTTIERSRPVAGASLSRALAPLIQHAPAAVGRLVGELLYRHFPEFSRVRRAPWRPD